MSTLTTSPSPAAAEARAAATTPPVGPEPMVASGRVFVALGVATPPELVARRSSSANPAAARRDSSRSRYRTIGGPTNALTSVVDVRSNSGGFGHTSCERETSSTSGYSSKMSSRARSSCAGLR